MAIMSGTPSPVSCWSKLNAYASLTSYNFESILLQMALSYDTIRDNSFIRSAPAIPVFGLTGLDPRSRDG